MGKHQKKENEKLAAHPDVVAAMQYIADTEVKLESLDAEKKALKANLKDAKKQLKKLLKAKPEKKAKKEKAKKKSKADSKEKEVAVVELKAKTATTKKAAGKN